MGEERPESHNLDIDDKTGKDVLDYLRNLTENNRGNWTWQYEFYFTIPDILQAKLFPKPTDDDPGNADLEFTYTEHHHPLPNTWDKLRGLMENKKFIDDRNQFLNQNLKTVVESFGPDPNAFAANFMLLFEIARRVDSNQEGYPITREETEAVIEKVFSEATYRNPRKKTYEQMVSIGFVI